MVENLDSDKLSFVDFISRLLCWRPEDRPTIGEVVSKVFL